MRTTTTLASTAAVLAAAALALTGCGAHPTASQGQSLPASPVADTPSATATPASTPATAPTAVTPAPVSATPSATPTPTTPKPLFATPEAAMAFMAKAFNADDLAALRTVTTPQSRRELFDMWPNPVHLRLSRCEKETGGSSYVCFFPHDPPKGMDPTSVPEATMVVEPAARPGWYMSDLSECG